MENKNNIQERILDRVKAHYEDNIHILPGNMKFPQSLKPYCIFDAYIGQPDLYRVSICFHEGPWCEDEEEEILYEVQSWCGANPSHYIFLFDVTDENGYSWVDEDLTGMDQCNGFWTFSITDEYREVRHSISQMLNILDGFAWKIGCRVGKNEDLLLLLTQATCPHCGEKMWIPDSLVLSIEKPTNLEKKPIIISLNSIHRYSDTTYEQIRRTLQQAYPQYCTLSERAEHCFHADCPSCQKTAVDFNQHDYEYFQYEKGPTWFEWLDLASLPEKMKLVSIPDVILTQEDADLTNEALTGADGFVCCGIYWLDEIIINSFETTYTNEALGSYYNVERNLNHHPAFKVNLKPCDAKYHIHLAKRIHENYSITLLKAICNSIGIPDSTDTE